MICKRINMEYGGTPECEEISYEILEKDETYK
jgi:hypothetical protein